MVQRRVSKEEEILSTNVPVLTVKADTVFETLIWFLVVQREGNFFQWRRTNTSIEIKQVDQLKYKTMGNSTSVDYDYTAALLKENDCCLTYEVRFFCAFSRVLNHSGFVHSCWFPEESKRAMNESCWNVVFTISNWRHLLWEFIQI